MIGGLAGMLFGGLFANMGFMGNILGLFINLIAVFVVIGLIRKIYTMFKNNKNKRIQIHGEVNHFEQDIINAICVYISRKKQVKPEEVEVELMYDDDYGFSAEVFVDGRKQVLITVNLIEALRLWLDEQLNQDPYAGIELVLDDEQGIIAVIS